MGNDGNNDARAAFTFRRNRIASLQFYNSFLNRQRRG